MKQRIYIYLAYNSITDREMVEVYGFEMGDCNVMTRVLIDNREIEVDVPKDSAMLILNARLAGLENLKVQLRTNSQLEVNAIDNKIQELTAIEDKTGVAA